MNPTTTTREERYPLEVIDGSYVVRNEREEALWRAFINTFAKNHQTHDLFTFEEVLSAYHAFLQAILHMEKAAMLLLN